jgi:hypothetical protein
MKQCRRVAMRYDKLAANYFPFVQLASIKPWLRVNESTPSLDPFYFDAFSLREPAATHGSSPRACFA